MPYFTAAANKGVKLPRKAVEALVLMLSPFAPHVAEECWEILGEVIIMQFTTTSICHRGI